MKEIDKTGFMCLISMSIMTVFYWTSNLNVIISSIMQFIGIIFIGIITSKYQKKLKDDALGESK